MMKVLFVCTGNICRSPTAEGVLRKRLEDAGLEVHVESAGTHDYHIGDPPDARSINAAAARGYDISAQRARLLSSKDYKHFDYLLALDDGHFEIMQAQCPPQYRHKLHKVMAFAPDAGCSEVPDPYYRSAKAFEHVLDLLEQAADGLLAELSKNK